MFHLLSTAGLVSGRIRERERRYPRGPRFDEALTLALARVTLTFALPPT